jgi:hypothetical protein
VLLGLATAALLLGGAITSGGTQWPEVGRLVAVVLLLVGMLVSKPYVEEKLDESERKKQTRTLAAQTDQGAVGTPPKSESADSTAGQQTAPKRARRRQSDPGTELEATLDKS